MQYEKVLTIKFLKGFDEREKFIVEIMVLVGNLICDLWNLIKDILNISDEVQVESWPILLQLSILHGNITNKIQ